MANIKVSEMTEATSFDDGDYTMIIQSNGNKKISHENILGDIETNISTNTSNITALDTEIGNITNLTTTDKTSVVNAINSIKAFFEFTTTETITTGTISGGGTISGINVTIKKNANGSLAKIYGQLDISSQGHSGNLVLSSSLRPTAELSVADVAYRCVTKSGDVINNSIVTITIGTNGNITIPYVYVSTSGENYRLSFFGNFIYIS